MDAAALYRVFVERLRRTVEQFPTPSGRSSQRAFCEAYGYDRENLQSVLAGKQEMSVSLLLRLEATLYGKAAPELPPGVERWSARTWLEMNQNPVFSAIVGIILRE